MQSFTALAPPSEPDRHPPEAERQVLLNFGVTFKPFVVSRAKGVYLYTTDDRKLLDWSSGQMASLLGHSHPTITKAITTAAGNLDHLLSCNISPPVIELASRLVDLLPPGLDKAMFLSTGSEACEAAIRMAKLVTGRYEVVGLGSSWHGMTGASVAAQYHSGRKGYGPVVTSPTFVDGKNKTKQNQKETKNNRWVERALTMQQDPGKLQPSFPRWISVYLPQGRRFIRLANRT